MIHLTMFIELFSWKKKIAIPLCESWRKKLSYFAAFPRHFVTVLCYLESFTYTDNQVHNFGNVKERFDIGALKGKLWNIPISCRSKCLNYVNICIGWEHSYRPLSSARRKVSNIIKIINVGEYNVFNRPNEVVAVL